MVVLLFQITIKKWLMAFNGHYNEPAHVFFVSIAHAKRHSLNVHCQLPSGARCLNFGLSIYLQPLYVCMCSEGSGETVRMRRRV